MDGSLDESLETEGDYASPNGEKETECGDA